MERIMIIGCPCSGKSTLARTLSKKLDIPVVHLDRLWWQPGWVECSREEFDGKLEDKLQEPHWIMDGNYSRTMDRRLERCDTVIYLDYSRWVCLRGLLRRFAENRGRARPDMAEGCPERLEWGFVKYIWNFNRRNRAMIQICLAKAKHADRYTFKTRRELQYFLKTI